MATMITKTPRESFTITSRITRPADANSLGTVYGGLILEWMDMAVSLCARRHCNTRVNTVSTQTDFLHPLHVGHIARLEARVTRTFRTSLEVRVEMFDEDSYNSDETPIAVGVFFMIGLDKTLKPIAVPALQPETNLEKQLWNEAGERRQQRKNKGK